MEIAMLVDTYQAVAWLMRGPFEWRKGDGHRKGKVDWEVLSNYFAEYKDRIIQTGGRWT